MGHKNKLRLFLLGIIIVAAIFLRFYQLGVNPPALTWDEVALGYNAYSLGIDGRDEFGRFLPVDYLESFGDYKPPAYAYLDILPIKLFGLTPFAVRFPSALLGVLTVLLTYFLTKRIFYSSENKEMYALSSAFILALSPWHIMLSRAAFEANAATFFLVAGVLVFLVGIQERKWFLLLSAVFFVLSMYTFNSSRIVAPLLVAGLAIFFVKKLLRRKKQTIFAAIIGILLLLPLLPFLFSPQAKVRFQEVNIFSDTSLLATSNQEIVNDNNAPWSKIIHNRRVVYGLDFLQHYFDHFNPGYLFIRGDTNPKFSIQYVGQLYIWDLPFLIVGLLFLFRRREGYWWLIFFWLLIGIIPAATARETPHALRTETVLPTLQIIAGYGVVIALVFVRKNIKKYWIKNSIIFGGLFLLFVNVFYFQFEYYKQYPYRFSGVWQYGYAELIDYISKQSAYKKVYDSGFLGRPYIYYLFYTRTDPRDFRKTMMVTRDSYGFVDVKGFGKYIFTSNIKNELKTGDALYVDKVEEVPSGAKVLKLIRLVNGEANLVVYTY